MSRAIIKTLLISVLCSFTLLFFQNCSGGGDGTTVGNPLSEENQTLKVGFRTHSFSNTQMAFCISKVRLQVIELDDELDVPLLPGYLVVGTVTDLANGDVGQARIQRRANGVIQIYSYMNPSKLGRYVEINNNSDTLVYELDIPNGRYGSPEWISINQDCPETNDKTIVVDNPFGVFDSEVIFSLKDEGQFNVVDGLAPLQAVTTEDLAAGVSVVKSNAELDDFLENGNF